MRIELTVYKDYAYQGYRVMCLGRDNLNNILHVSNISELKFTDDYKLDQMIPAESGIVIDDHAAQVLMDDLWQVGLRPKELGDTQGVIATQQKHLDDTRKLAAKLLNKVLKDK